MRVWFDILTPKHARFFEPLYRELNAAGNDLLITTRFYREAVEALRLGRLPFQIVGEHGGGTKVGKLLASGRRVVKLAEQIGKWNPDLAISFSSPEAARVAFGLGIPHVMGNDSPHSWRVARLSIPLSRFVCSPWLIPRRIWLSFGARPDGIIPYRALDAAAWLKRFKPSPTVLRQLSLHKDKPIIVFRTEESFASYLEGRVSDDQPVIGPAIRELLRMKVDAQIVVSTRYGRQAPVLRQRFGSKIRVVDHIVDSTSLLHYSSIFIGSGGTMTVEAALMGKPAISCFPGPKVIYLEWLRRQRMVEQILSPRAIANATVKILGSERYQREHEMRGKKMLRHMEDPIKVISSAVKLTVSEAPKQGPD